MGENSFGASYPLLAGLGWAAVLAGTDQITIIEVTEHYRNPAPDPHQAKVAGTNSFFSRKKP